MGGLIATIGGVPASGVLFLPSLCTGSCNDLRAHRDGVHRHCEASHVCREPNVQRFCCFKAVA